MVDGQITHRSHVRSAERRAHQSVQREPTANRSMIRTVVYSLLVVEIAACLALFLRRRREYPITAYTMLVVAAVYTVLLGIRYASGPHAYRDAVISTRGIFMLATAAVCIESVRLMARSVNGRVAGDFALATSLLFAVLSIATTWGASTGLRPGIAGLNRQQEWAIACVVFVAASHWFYSRPRALAMPAQRHAIGAMAMLTANATALVILGEYRGVWIGEAAGLVVQRLGPLAALGWWIRRLPAN